MLIPDIYISNYSSERCAFSGSDITRSILIFAKGKPLGPKGLDWMKIHLINLTGFKKRSPLVCVCVCVCISFFLSSSLSRSLSLVCLSPSLSQLSHMYISGYDLNIEQFRRFCLLVSMFTCLALQFYRRNVSFFFVRLHLSGENQRWFCRMAT